MVPTAVIGAQANVPGSWEPTKDDVNQMQAAQIRELEARVGQQNLVGAQLIHVSLAMAEWLIDLGHGLDAITIAVPIEFRKKVGEDNHLTVSDGIDGCYIIKVREQAEPEGIEFAREQ